MISRSIGPGIAASHASTHRIDGMESVGGNFRARPKKSAAGTTPVRATGGTNAWISMAAAAPQTRRDRGSGTRSSRFRSRRYTTKRYAVTTGPIATVRRKGTPPGIRSRRRKRARRYSGAENPATYLNRFNPGGNIPGSRKAHAAGVLGGVAAGGGAQ